MLEKIPADKGKYEILAEVELFLMPDLDVVLVVFDIVRQFLER